MLHDILAVNLRGLYVMKNKEVGPLTKKLPDYDWGIVKQHTSRALETICLKKYTCGHFSFFFFVTMENLLQKIYIYVDTCVQRIQTTPSEGKNIWRLIHKF